MNSQQISISFLLIVLLTACVNVSVKNPVLSEILEIERHRDMIKLSKITDQSGDCDFSGRYCPIEYGFCETAHSEKQASDALHYYKGELNKIGWRMVKKDQPINAKSFEFKSYSRNSRKFETTLRLYQPLLRVYSAERKVTSPALETHSVCFFFVEMENYSQRQSDIINALRALEQKDIQRID